MKKIKKSIIAVLIGLLFLFIAGCEYEELKIVEEEHRDERLLRSEIGRVFVYKGRIYNISHGIRVMDRVTRKPIVMSSANGIHWTKHDNNLNLYYPRENLHTGEGYTIAIHDGKIYLFNTNKVNSTSVFYSFDGKSWVRCNRYDGYRTNERPHVVSFMGELYFTAGPVLQFNNILWSIRNSATLLYSVNGLDWPLAPDPVWIDRSRDSRVSSFFVYNDKLWVYCTYRHYPGTTNMSRYAYLWYADIENVDNWKIAEINLPTFNNSVTSVMSSRSVNFNGARYYYVDDISNKTEITVFRTTDFVNWERL